MSEREKLFKKLGFKTVCVYQIQMECGAVVAQGEDKEEVESRTYKKWNDSVGLLSRFIGKSSRI